MLRIDVEINNLPKDFDSREFNEDYMVVRRANDAKLWYYGIYKGRDRAYKIAEEIGNGIVLYLYKE